MLLHRAADGVEGERKVENCEVHEDPTVTNPAIFVGAFSRVEGGPFTLDSMATRIEVDIQMEGGTSEDPLHCQLSL